MKDKELRHHYQGLTTLVTGSASGIGYELAIGLAKKGARVLAWDKDSYGLSKLDGENIETTVVDLTNHVDLDHHLAQLAHRRIDLVINNAGWSPTQEFFEMDSAVIRQIIDINLTAPAIITAQALRIMRGQQLVRNSRGHIIQISSLSEVVTFNGLGPYSMAKRGLGSLHEITRKENKGQRIAITHVYPPETDTNFFKSQGGEAYYEEAKQLGILFSPEDVASKIIFEIPNRPRIIDFYPDSFFRRVLRHLPADLHETFLTHANKVMKPHPPRRTKD